jgi:dTDP-4-amino-4,6-dideoxygalactose transaminase
MHGPIAGELSTAIERVLAAEWYILGPEVEAFEAELANHEGVHHAVGVGNGLDALTLVMRAMGIGPGDEVIVPSNTFVATWLAVSMVGAIPVPVEPLASTHNIDPDQVEAAVSPRTAAIMPVHLYGQPAELDRINQVADRHGLAVIADGAQSIGARFRDQPVATLCRATTLSFYPGKNLGALGDGGAVLTNDDELAERIRLLRNYGSRRRYSHEVAGQNSRLDEVQAAVLRVKLAHLDGWTSRRREAAASYQQGLAGTSIVLPEVHERADPVWHLYVVRHPARDALAQHLSECGIETLIHYPVPPHRQHAYSAAGWVLPMADELAGTVLSLPMGPHLLSDEVDVVVSAVREFA